MIADLCETIMTLIFIVFIGFLIILPVYVNIFKENIWEYIKKRMEEDAKAEKLRKQMLESKAKKSKKK